jgi:multiple sugar transport system ATP-binding protein
MAEIRFEHMTKRFGSVVAVQDFNLTIADKEFLTLVGPSGCGKSTTLNVLAGLEDPSEGLVYIDDEIVNDVPPGKRDIAMVFQSYALYPHMTVRQNIGFGLKVRKTPAAEIKQRVKEAAELLGIAPLLDRRPRELSGGQRQRVALGRAITRDPKVFLLDEPLSNLDAKLRTQMRADLKLLFNRLGGTVVYVTHDQAEAMTLSDRVAVMNEGVIQQVGPPLALYDDPNNLFVAGFLGNPSMNFITCRLAPQEGQLTLRTEDTRWPVMLDRPQAYMDQAGETAILGVRPEDVTVALPGESFDALRQAQGDLRQAQGALGAEEIATPCTVQVVEHMGALNIIYVDVDGHRVVATMETDFHARTGDRALVAFNPNKVHIFNQDTTQKVRV